MLVGQGVIHLFHKGNRGEDQVTHLVHGSLHTGTVVLGERLEGDVPCLFPGRVEIDLLDLCHVLERLPFPSRLDFGAQDAIPRLRKTGELVTVESVECTASALQDQQLLNLGADSYAFVLTSHSFDDADFGAVAIEGVRVRLAINVHARPAVLDDLDVRGMDVRVLVHKVVCEDGGELLGWVDGVLFGEDVGGLLLGVGGYDDRIISFGITAYDD